MGVSVDILYLRKSDFVLHHRKLRISTGMIKKEFNQYDFLDLKFVYHWLSTEEILKINNYKLAVTKYLRIPITKDVKYAKKIK